MTSVWDGVRPISDGRVARYRWSPGSMGVSPCLVEVHVQVVRNMIPNPAGTYLIRRALKNDSDPYHECSKRCHERQVMKVSVQTRKSCFLKKENPETYLKRCALKNDGDPNHECSKRSHERQVMSVFVKTVIRRCYEVGTKMKGCC